MVSRRDAKTQEREKIKPENEISAMILDSCIRVRRVLGPGLLESVYEEALSHELRKRGRIIERQVEIPVIYDSVTMNIGFRADMIVDKLVIIELKSVDCIQPVHKKQLLTYLKLTNIKLGLLVNFNVNLMKDGMTRIVMVYNHKHYLFFASLRLCEK